MLRSVWLTSTTSTFPTTAPGAEAVEAKEGLAESGDETVDTLAQNWWSSHGWRPAREKAEAR